MRYVCVPVQIKDVIVLYSSAATEATAGLVEQGGQGNDGGVPLEYLPDKMPLALAGPNRHASFGFLH